MPPARASRRVVVGGLGFDPLTEHETVELVLSELAAGNGGSIVTPNVDILRQTASSNDLHRLVAASTLVVPDGAPVLWAAALQRTPLPERVAGSSLVWALARGAARQDVPVFLLGGSPGVAARACAVLRDTFPEIRLVGSSCPPWGFERSEDEVQAIEQQVAALPQAIVLCGLSFPKQERLIARLREAHPGHWYLGCGAGLAFVAGDLRRAPRMVQRAGLEWCYRLYQEPGRLFRRYVVHDLPYALRLLSAAAARGAVAVRG